MTGKTRFTILAACPLNKEPHLAPAFARLKFGAATLKNAQQGRNSVRPTVPKKVLHSRASNSCFHPISPR
jgi:hypothetical protein